MVLDSNVSKEISESISELLGQNVRTTLKIQVKLETSRPEKQDQKILVLGDHRLYVFTVRTPTRIQKEYDIHFLELQGIESKDIKLIFKYDANKKLVMFTTGNPEEIDKVVFQISDSLMQIFPHMPLEKLIGPLDISPPERMKSVSEQLKTKTLHREVSPCGNFSAQYRCMCELHGLPYLDEVAWDIDTIYLSQNCKQLQLRDFDHLESKHLTPIISSLRYNNWFTRMCSCHVKMKPDALHEYANVLKTNTTLEAVCLINAGIRTDSLQRMCNSIMTNIKDTSINSIEIKKNSIEDRGLNALCPVIAKLPKGLEYLGLSKCNISASAVNKLSEALCNNPLISSTLKDIDLSGNNFKEDLTNLHNFLAQPNAISNLNLSGTECALDNIYGAIIRGCSSNLTHLDLSGNIFTASTKSKRTDVMVPVSWKQYFASSLALQHISIADNKLPLDAVKNLLLGINSNDNLKGVSVDLSSLALGSQGAQLLETCLQGNNNITSLDISNNDLNAGLVKILKALSISNHLKSLKIGKNFTSTRPRSIPIILEAMVELINAEDSALEYLSVADSKLKADTVIIINALGGNSSLLELDISGNGILDYGARMLSKALSINTKLQVIHWDRNGINPQGYEDVASALRRNFTLRKMPTPINDVTNAMRVHPEHKSTPRTQKALHQIEEYLQRNNSPRKFGSEQAYRLQQGFLFSSTQQAIDKYIVKLLDLITDLEKLDDISEDMEEDIQKGRYLMKDAENCRELMAQLQKIGQKSEESGNEIETKLKYMSEDLQQQLKKQIKTTVSQMVNCAEGKCFSIMEDKSMINKLQKGCEEKSELPKDFCKTLVMEQVSNDVCNKMSEVNVSVASYISEELIELLLESLDKCHTILNNHKTGESQLDRDARVSIIRPKDQPADAEVVIKNDTVKQLSRKSQYSRRPVSVAAVEQSATAPHKSGISQESELDDFVFVTSDGDNLSIISSGNNKDEQQQDAINTTVSPVPSPRNSAHDLSSSAAGGLNKRTPPKPPLPSVQKKPAATSTPTSQYVYVKQGPGDKFKPSPEIHSKTADDSSSRPKPVPRRRHTRGEDTDSLNRISEYSSVSSVTSIVNKSTDSKDSGISPSDGKSFKDSISSDLKMSDEVDVVVLVKEPPVSPKKQSPPVQKDKVEQQTSIISTKKPAPTIPDTLTEDDMSSEEEEDEQFSKESSKSTDIGGSLTDTTDTGSVDSLLDDPSSPFNNKSKSLQEKDKPKEKAKDKTPKSKSVKSMPDFDALAPSQAAPKLEHLTQNRPKRLKTRPQGKVLGRDESNTIEEEEVDISGFYETTAVAKVHKTATESTNKKKEKEMNATNAANSPDEEIVKKPKKKALAPPVGVKNISAGISNFFKSKSKGDPKSPEGSQPKSSDSKSSAKSSGKEHTSPSKTPDSRSSKENSPVTELPTRQASTTKDSEEKNTEEKAAHDTTPERPPAPRKFAGAQPMMGPGGADLLAEMKRKRGTRSIPQPKTDTENDASNSTKEASGKSTPPTRPPSLYPKLPSNDKSPLGLRSSQGDAEDKKPDEKTNSGDTNKPLPERPQPPARPRPKVKPKVPLPPQKEGGVEQQPSAVTPPPARPSVGPGRAQTVKSTKAPAPSIPTSNTASRGYSEPDDPSTTKITSDSEAGKERDPVRRRSSIKDRIALLDANSNEKPSTTTSPLVSSSNTTTTSPSITEADSSSSAKVTSPMPLGSGRGSPKTKHRPQSTNLCKEAQDKNADDSNTGPDIRPKSDELNYLRPQSMFGTSSHSAINAEFKSSQRRVAPTRPLSNLSENGTIEVRKEGEDKESIDNAEASSKEKEISRKSNTSVEEEFV